MISPIIARDLDFLSARLHGRRSRMAEGERLESLCLAKSVPDLGRELFADNKSLTADGLQHRIVNHLAREIADFRPCLNGAEALMAGWMLEHFQMANLKILLRGILAGKTPESIRSLLLDLPPKLPPDPALSSSRAVADLLQRLPATPLGQRLGQALPTGNDHPDPFIIEAGLDSRYFRDGLALAEALPGGDREKITAMVVLEADLFHVMLVIRGRFHYGLPPSKLSPFHITGTRISPRQFNAMMVSRDASTAASLVAGRAFPHPPAGGSTPVASLESLMWRHYRTLANRTFRQSTTGFGVFAGYIALRRVEVANLITLSEGIRMKTKRDSLRFHMIPPLTQEAPHV